MRTGLAFFGALVLCWMWQRHVKGAVQGALDPIPDDWVEGLVLILVLVGYFSALGYP